jgi:hypothetical protein
MVPVFSISKRNFFTVTPKRGKALNLQTGFNFFPPICVDHTRKFGTLHSALDTFFGYTLAFCGVVIKKCQLLLRAMKDAKNSNRNPIVGHL